MQQELYLDLLRLGKTERDIDSVKGMPSWPTRYLWLADKKFSTHRLEAQAQGVELALVSHEERCLHVYDKALDDAANKPLVDLLKEMGQHARWKASKLNRAVYGEKVSTELTGKDGKAIETKATVQIYMPSNGR
ncbi:hypothetical protein QWJ07_03930 [Frankia sp. RB7]|nr:hypothetical protein [Frankia sp. RB7]